MVPLLIFVYLGSYWLTAMCIFVGLVGVREFFNGFRAMDVHPSEPVAYVSMFVLYLINGLWPQQHEFIIAWLVFSVMASSIYIFKINEYKFRKKGKLLATNKICKIGVVYLKWLKKVFSFCLFYS